MTIDATERFTQRAQNYARYRPQYPPQIVNYLKEAAGLKPGSNIADIGSGTGKLSQLFLDHGYRVYGVEPNDEMRAMAEKQLVRYRNFSSVAASAEATTLPDAHINFITVAQAFHWFELNQAALEFKRILKRDGHVVLLWNRPRDTEAGFDLAMRELRDRHQLKGPLRPPDKDARIAAFFGGRVEKQTFDNARSINWEQFRGRFLSASWMPLPADERHDAVIADLRDIFDRYAVVGWFKDDLITELYLAQFSSS
jgi:SAM-dependent methyltransferase